MSQYDFGTIDASTKSGSALATDLNAFRSALHSTHKGSIAPSYVTDGMLWLDDSGDPTWVLKFYDGTTWITITTIDTAANSTNTVTKTGTETLTNKTLTAPTINAMTLTGDITGAVKASGNVTAESATFTGRNDTVVLSPSAAGGTVVLRPNGSGTATGQVIVNPTGTMTLGANPSVDLDAATKQYVDGLAIGVGQTWQDVSGSRAASTAYQNSTGRPIMVAISGSAGSPTVIQVSADNVTWDKASGLLAGSRVGNQFIVPDGWYYRVNGAATIEYWTELR